MEFGDLVWRILETSRVAATTVSGRTEASGAG
jgi:hypothetical protein